MRVESYGGDGFFVRDDPHVSFEWRSPLTTIFRDAALKARSKIYPVFSGLFRSI